MAHTYITLGIIAIVCLIVAQVIFTVYHGTEANCSYSDKKREHFKTLKSRTNKIVKIGAAVAISLVLVSPLTQPFEIYKKVLIYRGVESDTAEKAVDSINSLLDLANKKLKEEIDK
jgi:hypothetical protein